MKDERRAILRRMIAACERQAAALRELDDPYLAETVRLLEAERDNAQRQLDVLDRRSPVK
jgi:hypothetical protein